MKCSAVLFWFIILENVHRYSGIRLVFRRYSRNVFGNDEELCGGFDDPNRFSFHEHFQNSARDSLGLRKSFFLIDAFANVGGNCDSAHAILTGD